MRDLLNHLVGVNLVFVALARDEVPPRLGDDYLGDDSATAYHDTGAAVVAAFDEPGALERIYQSALGTASGAVRLHWRIPISRAIGMRSRSTVRSMRLYSICSATSGAQPRSSVPGTVGDMLDHVDGFLMLVVVLAAYGTALGGVAWLAFRVRRRGIRGVGDSFMGPFEEIWHPAAYRARVEIRVQEERKAPSPSPGDPPPTG